MEKNIFEGAKFGDKFVTSDGRVAVFLGEWKYIIGKNPNIYKFWIEGEEETIEYDSTGLSYPCETRCELDNRVVEVWNTDIVSRYQEPIDEKVVQKLGNHYLEIIREPDDESSKVSFTTGYRMGWTHMTEFVDYLKAKEE